MIVENHTISGEFSGAWDIFPTKQKTLSRPGNHILQAEQWKGVQFQSKNPEVTFRQALSISILLSSILSHNYQITEYCN